MRIISDFREAMWGALQAVVGEIEMDYTAYADKHFARLLAAADDPRFYAKFKQPYAVIHRHDIHGVFLRACQASNLVTLENNRI
jgi:hypothetical protein